MPFTTAILAGLTGALVAPWIQKRLSHASRASRLQDGYRVLEFGTGERLVTLVGAAFFFGLCGLAYRFPGPAGVKGIVGPLMVFAFLGAFSLVGYAFMRRSVYYWNDLEICGPTTWGREVTLNWDDLQQVEYVAWAQSFRLRTPQGQSLWISPSMRGFDTLMTHLKQSGKLPETC